MSTLPLKLTSEGAVVVVAIEAWLVMLTVTDVRPAECPSEILTQRAYDQGIDSKSALTQFR